MHSKHFSTTALPGGTGYTWTLPSRMGQMLNQVETLYGSRDTSWAILGVEIGGDIPHLWYPGNRNHVLVQLGITALDDHYQACYQLAHETIHLLSPTGTAHAPVIEEGLATVYSDDYMKSEFNLTWCPDVASYASAASLVRELLAVNQNAIRILRTKTPSFCELKEESFAIAGLNIHHQLATDLVKPFNR